MRGKRAVSAHKAPEVAWARAGRSACRRGGETAWALCLLTALAVGSARPAAANWVPARGPIDSRMRIAPYSPDQVYRLYGYVGYQIDIEFASGEVFKGLAAGDWSATIRTFG